MRKMPLAACVLVALAMSAAGMAQRAMPGAATGHELYQRGLVQEHARGDLVQAIALYRQAVIAAGGDRPLAARALIRIAESQEKLGAGTEARSSYSEVVRGYPEQRREVALAQERLAALSRDVPGRSSPKRPAFVADPSSSTRPFVEKYCLGCHNPRNRAGGLDLDPVSRAALIENAALWEAVIRRLRVHRDPPLGTPRPDETTYRAAVASLEGGLDAAYAASRTHPAERATDTQLAARLAAFLWNGPADAPLLDAARRGDLREPSGLQREVLRMLGDPRAASLIDAFFRPWLSLDRLTASHERPEAALPRLDADLIQAMGRETRLFLESQLRDDRDPVELWTANYTFMNERLARHYGVPGVSGQEFRRVAWPDANRAGLLGQAGLLTALSLTSRTSPTVRGLYVWTRFLGLDAPPPPANVPALAEQPPSPGAMRDRLLAHKTNPSCARCHSLFDPLGLSLEQFDATGNWRTADAGVPIDPSGTFVDGTRFDGPAGLRAALLKHRESYYMALTEQLLTHALNRKGRNGRVYDYEMPVVRKIVRDASIGGYRWSALVAGIAASAPFQAKHLVP
jgi:hypothetical protein